MISEKKMRYYEYLAFSFASTEVQKAITQLVDEVRKLENEIMWLAEYLEYATEYCHKSQSIDNHCDKRLDKGSCAKCWREAAYKAVRDNMEI